MGRVDGVSARVACKRRRTRPGRPRPRGRIETGTQRPRGRRGSGRAALSEEFLGPASLYRQPRISCVKHTHTHVCACACVHTCACGDFTKGHFRACSREVLESPAWRLKRPCDSVPAEPPPRLPWSSCWRRAWEAAVSISAFPPPEDGHPCCAPLRGGSLVAPSTGVTGVTVHLPVASISAIARRWSPSKGRTCKGAERSKRIFKRPPRL